MAEVLDNAQRAIGEAINAAVINDVNQESTERLMRVIIDCMMNKGLSPYRVANIAIECVGHRVKELNSSRPRGYAQTAQQLVTVVVGTVIGSKLLTVREIIQLIVLANLFRSAGEAAIESIEQYISRDVQSKIEIAIQSGVDEDALIALGKAIQTLTESVPTGFAMNSVARAITNSGMPYLEDDKLVPLTLVILESFIPTSIDTINAMKASLQNLLDFAARVIAFSAFFDALEQAIFNLVTRSSKLQMADIIPVFFEVIMSSKRDLTHLLETIVRALININLRPTGLTLPKSMNNLMESAIRSIIMAVSYADEDARKSAIYTLNEQILHVCFMIIVNDIIQHGTIGGNFKMMVGNIDLLMKAFSDSVPWSIVITTLINVFSSVSLDKIFAIKIIETVVEVIIHTQVWTAESCDILRSFITQLDRPMLAAIRSPEDIYVLQAALNAIGKCCELMRHSCVLGDLMSDEIMPQYELNSHFDGLIEVVSRYFTKEERNLSLLTMANIFIDTFWDVSNSCFVLPIPQIVTAVMQGMVVFGIPFASEKTRIDIMRIMQNCICVAVEDMVAVFDHDLDSDLDILKKSGISAFIRIVTQANMIALFIHDDAQTLPVIMRFAMTRLVQLGVPINDIVVNAVGAIRLLYTPEDNVAAMLEIFITTTIRANIGRLQDILHTAIVLPPDAITNALNAMTQAIKHQGNYITQAIEMLNIITVQVTIRAIFDHIVRHELAREFFVHVGQDIMNMLERLGVTIPNAIMGTIRATDNLGLGTYDLSEIMMVTMQGIITTYANILRMEDCLRVLDTMPDLMKSAVNIMLLAAESPNDIGAAQNAVDAIEQMIALVAIRIMITNIAIRKGTPITELTSGTIGSLMGARMPIFHIVVAIVSMAPEITPPMVGAIVDTILCVSLGIPEFDSSSVSMKARLSIKNAKDALAKAVADPASHTAMQHVVDALDSMTAQVNMDINELNSSDDEVNHPTSTTDDDDDDKEKKEEEDRRESSPDVGEEEDEMSM